MSHDNLFCRGRCKIGIYFLIKESTYVYIGKSKRCCDNRVFDHKKNADKDFDCYEVAECDIADIDILEEYYIRKYAPKYNQTLVALPTDEYNERVFKIMLSAIMRVPHIPNTRMTRRYIVQLRQHLRDLGETRDRKWIM